MDGYGQIWTAELSMDVHFCLYLSIQSKEPDMYNAIDRIDLIKISW